MTKKGVLTALMFFLSLLGTFAWFAYATSDQNRPHSLLGTPIKIWCVFLLLACVIKYWEKLTFPFRLVGAKLKPYWKLLLPLVVILLGLGLYQGIEHYKEQQLKNYYGEFLSYRPPKRIKKAEFLGDQAVAIDWENTDKKADRYIPKNI